MNKVDCVIKNSTVESKYVYIFIHQVMVASKKYKNSKIYNN